MTLTLVPTLLVAGAAVGLALRQVLRRQRRGPETSLGRMAFAQNLVRSRRRLR